MLTGVSSGVMSGSGCLAGSTDAYQNGEYDCNTDHFEYTVQADGRFSFNVGNTEKNEQDDCADPESASYLERTEVS